MADFFQWRHNGVLRATIGTARRYNAEFGVDYVNRRHRQVEYVDNRPTETQYFYTGRRRRSARRSRHERLHHLVPPPTVTAGAPASGR